MYNYGAMPVVYCGHTAAVGIMSTCDKTRYSAAKIERIVLVALRKQLEIFQSMAKILEEGEEKQNKFTSNAKKYGTGIRKIEGGTYTAVRSIC